jgi:hypothetical protein
VSAPLLGEDAPDAEEMVVRWLSPLLRTAVERTNDEVLPFCQVTQVDGADDPNEGIDDPVIQLDILDTARSGMLAAQAAKLTARRVHRRMTLLARQSPTVTLSDGSHANADYVTPLLKPRRMEYPNERVVRYVARYQLGLSYVAV